MRGKHRKKHTDKYTPPCEWLQLFEMQLRIAFQSPRGPCKRTTCWIHQIEQRAIGSETFHRYRAYVTFSTQL